MFIVNGLRTLVRELDASFLMTHGYKAEARPGQGLLDHLEEVAQACASRLPALGEIAFCAGLLHDVGKYNPAFQAAMQQDRKAPPHSVVGAMLVSDASSKARTVLAMAIACHHSGWRDYHDPLDIQRSLSHRFADTISAQLLAASVPLTFVTRIRATLTGLTFPSGLDHSLSARLLLSTLVDVDRCNAAKSQSPTGVSWSSAYASGSARLKQFQDDYASRIAAIPCPDQAHRMQLLSTIRSNLAADAIQAATGPQRFYTLTGPLGSGKTFAYLMFAARHAMEHGLDRIIIVSPRQAITSEAASAARWLFPMARVIEHHASVVPENFSNHAVEGPIKTLKQNWTDADIIVTTNVQFLESMYTARSGKSRKLANYQRAVIVLDEAHLVLPWSYLNVVGRDLNRLVADHASTVVLASATQSTWAARPKKGFVGFKTTEINPDVTDTFADTVRVQPFVHGDLDVPVDWFELAEALRDEPSVLCVVNEIAQAKTLHGFMPEGTFLLTSHFCAKHRADILIEIKRRQAAGEPVRLISTSLVEVGVNLDFPVVYRALSDLASIIQAMGRCNRNWTISMGRFSVFASPDKSRDPLLLAKRAASKRFLVQHQDSLQRLLDPDTLQVYNNAVIAASANLDSKGLYSLLEREKAFRTASDRFRIIEEETVSVIVPYGEQGRALIRDLEKGIPVDWLEVQPYVVSIRETVRRFLVGNGLNVIDGGFGFLYVRDYSEIIGLAAPSQEPLRGRFAVRALSGAH